MRDIGPTFVVDAHGDRRGVDWEFNAWGGERGGLYASWAHDDAMAAAVCAAERRRPLPRADRRRGRRDPHRRRGHAARDRGVPAQRRTATRPVEGRDRGRAVRVHRRDERSYGSGSASWPTRPTATSTTSRASSGPASWCSPSPTTATIRSTGGRATPGAGSRPRRRAWPPLRGARAAPAGSAVRHRRGGRRCDVRARARSRAAPATGSRRPT